MIEIVTFSLNHNLRLIAKHNAKYNTMQIGQHWVTNDLPQTHDILYFSQGMNQHFFIYSTRVQRNNRESEQENIQWFSCSAKQ